MTVEPIETITILSQPQAVMLGDLQRITTAAIQGGVSCGDVVCALQMRILDLQTWMFQEINRPKI